jgi:DNA polymerase (family X)
MNNIEYGTILREIALLKQIRGENHFRVRAYESGAKVIEELEESIEGLLEAGTDVTTLDGIGKGLATELMEIFSTGSSPTRSHLLESLDPQILELFSVQGLGPKRIKLLYDELGVTNLSSLEHAAREGHIASIKGLGPKSQKKILAELERLAHTAGKTPLPQAMAWAEEIGRFMESTGLITRWEIAGSIRRRKELVGDIDILVTTSESAAIFDCVSALTRVREVIAKGPTKMSVRLSHGIQVDIRAVEEAVFGSALYYFTGSKEHHIEVRKQAKRAGLRVNEYGVFDQGDLGQAIAAASEEEIFAALGMAYIAPELREGGGEIQAARENRLPLLVQAQDVLGDLHMHTTETDGRHSIAEMATAAAERRYRYIVITDHSQAVTVANGMTPERFRTHIDRIRRFDASFEPVRVLAGIEVDILGDGTLDMEPELLAECDWVVGSVHSSFGQDSKTTTERLLRAIRSGLLSCLGHPTGRILGGRNGIQYDFDTIVEEAVRFGVALEINGSPQRIDLAAKLARRAANAGALIVLGSDAHGTQGLRYMRHAVDQARRAGLTKDNVLNTREVEDLLASVRTG